MIWEFKPTGVGFNTTVGLCQLPPMAVFAIGLITQSSKEGNIITSFYEAACKVSKFPNPWWGSPDVLTDDQFKKANAFAQIGDLAAFSSTEESFMFLLFVALSEGEES